MNAHMLTVKDVFSSLTSLLHTPGEKGKTKVNHGSGQNESEKRGSHVTQDVVIVRILNINADKHTHMRAHTRNQSLFIFFL